MVGQETVLNPMCDCEASFFDDVKNVDWFFLKSVKSKGNSNGVLITHQGRIENN